MVFFFEFAPPSHMSLVPYRSTNKILVSLDTLTLVRHTPLWSSGEIESSEHYLLLAFLLLVCFLF